MKKLLTRAATGLAFLPLSAQSVFAANTLNACGGGQFGNLCRLTEGSLGNVLGAVINFIFLIAAIIALIYLVLGGIKWITSEGDTKNVEAARNQIIAAAIGLAITFLSYLIVNLVLNIFIGQSINNLDVSNIRISPE